MKQKAHNRLAALLLTLALPTLLLGGCVPQPDRNVEMEQEETEVEEQAFPGVEGLSEENYPRVDGSTANIPLMAEVYSRVCGVSRERGEAAVRASGGTGAVWRNMMSEGADLLLVYEAPEVIKNEMEEQGLRLEMDPVGRDGLVFLVNAANPVESLTLEELQGIYTGAITDWQEVGGEPGPITAFQRNEESGSQTLFRKLLMPGLTPMKPPTELVPAGMGALIDGVAAYDGSGGAIGYSVYYYAQLMYANPDLKLLQVDGVAPASESIADSSYPLVNDFYVVIRQEEPAGSSARLLREWILSEEGKRALEDTGYVSAR